MQSGSFTTSAAYPAEPQTGLWPSAVRVDLLVSAAVTIELWQGAHGQQVPIGEFTAEQSVQIPGATGVRVKDGVAGTPATVQWVVWETRDPLPSFVALGATQQVVPSTLASIRSMQVFTTPGANTYTLPASITAILVECIGGGGGGGGSGGASNNNSSGGGGSGGGYASVLIINPAASYPYVVGAVGTQGSNAGGNGGNGGLSSFGSGPTLCSAAGGLGGAGVNAAGALGAPGAAVAATIGAILVQSQGGGAGGGGSTGIGGSAGGRGGGGGASVVAPGDGASGGQGGGGSGGGGATHLGGQGGAGLVIVTEFGG